MLREPGNSANQNVFYFCGVVYDFKSCLFNNMQRAQNASSVCLSVFAKSDIARLLAKT